MVTRRYQVNADGVGEFPIDAALGLDEHSVSPGAREVLCTLGMDMSFSKAAANAKRLAGVAAGHEFVRGAVEREGEKVTQARDSGALPAAFTAEGAVVTDATTGAQLTRLYVGVDGFFVPVITVAEKHKRRTKAEIRRDILTKAGTAFAKPLSPEIGGYGEGYKEMKLLTFYNESKSLMHVAATGGDCHQAGLLLRIHAAQVKLLEAAETISLTDGAVWIIVQLKKHLARLTAMLLDCFHLKEHVHAAAVALLGKGAEADDWTQDRMKEFKELSAADALGAMAAAGKASTNEEARKELDNLINYVTERIDMLGYKHALSKDWDIGSGPTEAQCKVEGNRMKIGGAKWNPENAPKILNLIAMSTSKQAQTYWRRLAA